MAKRTVDDWYHAAWLERDIFDAKVWRLFSTWHALIRDDEGNDIATGRGDSLANAIIAACREVLGDE